MTKTLNWKEHRDLTDDVEWKENNRRILDINMSKILDCKFLRGPKVLRITMVNTVICENKESFTTAVRPSMTRWNTKAPAEPTSNKTIIHFKHPSVKNTGVQDT